jgi:hypothetical protein
VPPPLTTAGLYCWRAISNKTTKYAILFSGILYLIFNVHITHEKFDSKIKKKKLPKRDYRRQVKSNFCFIIRTARNDAECT